MNFSKLSVAWFFASGLCAVLLIVFFHDSSLKSLGIQSSVVWHLLEKLSNASLEQTSSQHKLKHYLSHKDKILRYSILKGWRSKFLNKSATFDSLEKRIFRTDVSAHFIENTQVLDMCSASMRELQYWDEKAKDVVEACLLKKKRCKHSSLWGCFYASELGKGSRLAMKSMEKLNFNLPLKYKTCLERWKMIKKIQKRKQIISLMQSKAQRYLPADRTNFLGNHNHSSSENICNAPPHGVLTEDCLEIMKSLDKSLLEQRGRENPKLIFDDHDSLVHCSNIEALFIGECIADLLLKDCEAPAMYKIRKELLLPKL